MVLVICLYGALAMLVWDAATVGTGGRSRLMSLAGSVTALAVGVHAHLAIAYNRGLLSAAWPGLLFPLVFCVFHFGSFYEPEFFEWYNDGLVAVAWNLSVVCLLAWMVGYSFTRGTILFVPRPQAVSGGRTLAPADLARIERLGVLLLWGGLGLQLAFMLDVGIMRLFTVSYKQSKLLITPESGNPMAYVMAIGMMCSLCGTIVASTASSIGRGRLFPGFLAATGVGVHVVSLMLQGDRSEMSMVIFPLLLLRHYYVKPISFKRALLLGSLLLMLFAGLKVFRIMKNPSDLVAGATNTERVRRAADEMGYTLDTVVRSMEVVPHRDDYFYGMTYLHALARALPNVTFSRRSWGFVSSAWVQEQTRESGFRRVGGLGFSIVAEAFINFGVLGAPVVLLAMGAAHGRMERWLAGRQVVPWLVMLYMVLEIGLVVHVRNSVVLYIRAAIWMAAILAIVHTIYRLGEALRLRQDEV